MKLHELRDNPGATRKRRRVGRGPGSGKGKTAGRGMKGQKSRSGVALGGFEGGQMPIYQRLPKRGFNNPSAKRYSEVNLGKLQQFIDAGRIDAAGIIDAEVMETSGLVRRRRDGIRILGQGKLTGKVDIVASGATRSAISAVEAAGGSLKIEQRTTNPDDTAPVQE